MFLHQSGIDLSTDNRIRIYESFSGIDMRDIGHRFRVPKKPFKGIAKKPKKRMNRIIDKALNSVRTTEHYRSSKKHKRNKTKVTVKSKPITTTFFCNDDEEWCKKIDTILGENTKTDEVNN
jgi:hypothetical protein